jgi:hypothetical protein
MNSYYQALGIPEGADLPTIKRAYRELAKKYHPDHNPDPSAKEQFIQVTEAYEYLIGKAAAPSVSYASYTSTYEEEIRARAREYARIRYDRLSVHKIFWGKGISWMLVLGSFLFLSDFIVPQVVETIPVSKVALSRFEKSNIIKLKISANGFSFYASDEHVPRDFVSGPIQIAHTPFLKIVNEYRLPGNNYRFSYHPEQRLKDYLFFPFAVFLLSFVTLTYRFKTFENKLMIKMLTIISLVCFATILFVCR